jgi:TM2 domain-containing membrane protein YozV
VFKNFIKLWLLCLKLKIMVSPHQTLDKNRKVAIALAFVGAFQPTPFPLTFLHKLYLRQYLWSGVYLLLGLTQIARVACICEGLWYLFAEKDEAFANPLTFKSVQLSGYSLHRMPPVNVAPQTAVTPPDEQVGAVATALRDLERLRQEGLLSEYEFEQKRRGLLDQLS